MKKYLFFTLLFFATNFFYFQAIKAQYNFPIENRPEIYHHIGFDANMVYLVNEHLYAVSAGDEKLLTVFDVGYTKSIQVLKKIKIKNDVNTAICSLATLLGDTISAESYLYESCNRIFKTPKNKLFHIQKKENVVSFLEEGKAISSLELPDKVGVRRKYLQTITLNNRYIAMLYDNLYLVDAYDICEPKIVGKYSFDEIEEVSANRQAGYTILMKRSQKQTVFISTKRHYFWIDVSDVEKPILKAKYAAEEYWVPEIVIENENLDTVFINQVAAGGEGYSEQKLMMLVRNNASKEWKKRIIHEAFGSDIEIINNVGKTKNDKYLYFHDFNGFYIFNKQKAIIENVLYKTSTRRNDFVVLDDIVAVCGRNEFNDKINLFQNNGDASLNFVSNMSEEMRKKHSYCSVLTVKDNLMCLGGGHLGDGADAHGLTIFNIDNLSSPKYLFDGNKQKEVLPYRSYLTLSFYEKQLVASTTDSVSYTH